MHFLPVNDGDRSGSIITIKSNISRTADKIAGRDYVAEAFSIEQFDRKEMERLVQSPRSDRPEHEVFDGSGRRNLPETFVNQFAQMSENCPRNN
jgi:hypothetical protein